MKIIKYIGFLVSLVILFLITIFLGFGKIKEIKNQVLETGKTNKLLTQKVDILRTIETVLPSDISFVDIALPTKTPVLYVFNQIKNQAVNFGLITSNFKADKTTPDVSGIVKNPISFDVEGDILVIIEFLKTISTSLPLTTLEGVEIENLDGLTKAVVNLNTYSSDDPDKIPAIASSVNQLTEEEIKLLTELKDYTMPEFTEAVPSQEEGKVDPFAPI